MLPRCFLVAVNTGANSCATPTATTPARPVAACRARYGRITSILLAVVLAEAHHRDVVSLGEGRHRPAKRGTDLLEGGRRRNLIIQMGGQEGDHRPTGLQSWHIAIQINPIQTLNIQRYMPIEHVVHRRRRSNPNSPTATRPADQPPASAVRGEASLVGRLGID